MMKIAVCDDEKAFLAEMVVKLNKLLPQSEVRTFLSGEALLADDAGFDLVFLDIRMSGLDGMETAKRLRIKRDDVVIVFLTWEKECVFDAFDVGAFNYLLKPVDDKKLREVLGRAKSELAKRHEQQEQVIFIKNKGRGITLRLADILYFENVARKIVARTAESEVSHYGTMAEIEEKTGDRFFRCHRGYLVNLAHVSEYDAESILLSNGERIYIAKGRYSDFVKHYMRFLKNGGAIDT